LQYRTERKRKTTQVWDEHLGKYTALM
jgi:hypothetical protein